MGGEMIFYQSDGQPIGPRIQLYQSILEEIRKATAHLEPFDPNIPDLENDLKGIDLRHYELCLNLGKPYYIIFPKDPDSHKTQSWMSARRMTESSKSLIHPWLKKLEETFDCFDLWYPDGYSGFDYESMSEQDSYTDLDYTACSSDDCGYCGRCSY